MPPSMGALETARLFFPPADLPPAFVPVVIRAAANRLCKRAPKILLSVKPLIFTLHLMCDTVIM